MTEAELKALIGLDVDEARKCVEAKGFQFRLSGQDNTSFVFLHDDYREDRVNVHLLSGKIGAIDIG